MLHVSNFTCYVIFLCYILCSNVDLCYISGIMSPVMFQLLDFFDIFNMSFLNVILYVSFLCYLFYVTCHVLNVVYFMLYFFVIK